jgi:hypothetical protein
MFDPVLNAWRRFRAGAPIAVVTGLPRSGTSMAMRMLDAGGVAIVADNLRTADESNPNGYFELEAVKSLDTQQDRSWLKATRGKAIKIISFLLPYLPEDNRYQVIFMHRDLDEVLASQNKMLMSRGEPPGAPDAQLRTAYESHLARIDRLLGARRCFEVLHVNYVDVLDKPRTEAERIARFLQRPLDLDRMAAVTNPNLYRNRRRS